MKNTFFLVRNEKGSNKMGVERLFSTVTKTLDILSVRGMKQKCKYYLLDFNSILHVVSSGMDYTVITDNLHSHIVDAVVNYLCNIVLPFCEDVEYLFVSVDGVPSKSKMLEQRRRRYAGDAQEILREKIYREHGLNIPNKLWNRSEISPGTDFMKVLDLKMFTPEVRSKIRGVYPKLKYYIYSDSSVRGEGEHKILSFLRSLSLVENERIAIYSPDSDIPVLCLTLDMDTSRSIVVIRHNQQENNYDIIDIKKFYNEIFAEVGNSSHGVKDIALLFTIFGNDFVPKIPSYDVRYNFQHLFKAYLHAYYKTRQERLIVGNGKILNLALLRNIFSKLSETENQRLQINYLSHYNVNLPTTIYRMLDEGWIDPMAPIDNFLMVYMQHRFDPSYDDYFFKFNQKEFRIYTGVTNKDELKKISDPIEREYFEATHRIDPKDFLRLGEVELTYKDGVYRSRKGNYSSSDYYNEFFQEDRIPDVSKAYVIALKWVFNTYFLSHQNDWVYPYTRAPLMKDISEILFNPNDDFGIPNINLHFTPIQQLFYIIPIPRLVTLIPMPYRNEITPEILQKFQTELEKHVNDLMDLRGVTYANKGFSNFVFPLSDKEIKSMFPTYPKHGYDFDSPDIYVLRNQCFNLACYANILGTFLKGNDSDETIRRKNTCLKRRVLPILQRY